MYLRGWWGGVKFQSYLVSGVRYSYEVSDSFLVLPAPAIQFWPMVSAFWFVFYVGKLRG